jgi:hypothetical protein
MKKLFYLTKGILLLLALGLTLTGCSKEPLLETQEASLKIFKLDKSSADRSNRLHFNASLSGKNEVPERDTKAVGEVIITISKDETSVHYKVIVANINNVAAAHFHMAPANANGGVVRGIFQNPNPQPSGLMNGILAEGDITAANLTGALAGNLPGFIEAIRNGNIYVNVHTMAYPGGEIRGQL